VVGDFDPLPNWKKVNVPILFIYGGHDRNVDAEKSIAIIQKELGPLDKRYDVILSGTNGHAFIRDDLMDFVAEWIRDGGVD
jgi:dienelactone hydrolase